MKTLLSFLTALTGLLAWSQTVITKSCLSTCGGSATAGNTSVIFTAGELAVNETSQGTVHISEGFINPDMLATAEIENYIRGDNMVILYPNPATDFVHIQFHSSCDFQIRLFDLDGRELTEISGTDKQTGVSLKHIPPGEYLLLVKNLTGRKYKTFKILVSR